MPLWDQSPLMRAARCQPAPRTPVWLMRQAGRYLPEYRELRRRVSFLELCKTPDLCAEVMLRTVERLQVDAAIVFSDLLLILEPMGFRLEFTAGDGPKLANPIRTAADVDRLGELEDLAPLEFVMEAVRRTRTRLDERLPLIGFAGAPFTLAAYAIEGGASRSYHHTKRLMLTDCAAWCELMGRLARAVVRYLNAQLAAGAQLVQLFDSWVGCLGPDDYRQYVLPYSKAVIEAVQPGVPVIHFATGNPALLPLLAAAAGTRRRHTVIGIDWRVRLDDAWRAIGHDMAIQGNLDPAVLLSTPQEVRARARQILAHAGGRPGHIFNLGHGVLPQTPLENVLALIETVRETPSKFEEPRPPS
jgi:uroporphyrinogen decarboxylase